MADINEVATLEVHGESTGVDQVVSSLKSVSEAQTEVGTTAAASATVQESSAARTLSAASAYDRLLRSIDPVAKAQAQFATGQNTLQKALDQGLITSTQFSASQDLLERSLLGMGTSAGKAGDAVHELSARHLFTLQRSISELGIGLATGASPFSLMAVGAEHAAYILSEGGLGASLSSIGGKIAAMITPTVALAGGFAAVGIAAVTSVSHWLELQDSIEQGLSGIGRASGVTSADINQIAASIALVGTQSYASAAEAATAFIKVGAGARDSIGQAVEAEHLLVTRIGMEAPAATKALSAIFTDPVKGVQELNKETGFLSAGLLQTVQEMEAAGNHSAAVGIAMQALTEDLKQQESHVTGLSKLWQDFKNTISDISTAAGAKLADALGFRSLEENIKQTEAALAQAKQAAASAWNWDTSIAQAEVKALEQRLADLNDKMDIESLRSEKAALDQLGLAAKNIADSLNPAQSKLNQLNAELHAVEEGLRAVTSATSPNMAVVKQLTAAHDELAHAIATSTNADGTAITASQKLTEQYNLQVQAIHARSAAEKIALAGAQEAHSLEGQLISDADAKLAIMQKEQLVVEQLQQKWADYYNTIQQGGQSVLDQLHLQQDSIGKTAGEVDALRYSYQAYGALKKEIDSMGLSDQSAIDDLWKQGTAEIDRQASRIQDAGDELAAMQQQAKDAASAVKGITVNVDELNGALSGVSLSVRQVDNEFTALDNSISNFLGGSALAGFLNPTNTSGGGGTAPAGGNNPYPAGSTLFDTYNRIMGVAGGGLGYTHGALYHFNTGADITLGGSGAQDSIYLPLYVSPGERLIVLPAGQTGALPATGLPGSLSAGGFAQASSTTAAIAGSGGSISPTGAAGLPVFGFGGPTGQTYGGAMPASSPSVYGFGGPAGSSVAASGGGGYGPGGATGSLYGGLPVFGFASGLDYTIPGSGPPDSVSLPLHVSPGERLIVLPAGMAGMVPDLGLPGMTGAASGGVFAAGGLDTMAGLARAPAASGGLAADVAERLSRIEAAVAKFVDGQANGPPPLTMINHISVPPESNLGRSTPQVLSALARDVAAVLATRR